MAQVDQRSLFQGPPIFLWVATTRQLEKGLLESVAGVVARVDNSRHSVDDGLRQRRALD